MDLQHVAMGVQACMAVLATWLAVHFGASKTRVAEECRVGRREKAFLVAYLACYAVLQALALCGRSLWPKDALGVALLLTVHVLFVLTALRHLRRSRRGRCEPRDVEVPLEAFAGLLLFSMVAMLVYLIQLSLDAT